jgi:hypothetical protein
MSETVNYKGFEIKITQDELPLNPRHDWDNGTTMVCFHGRYDLGDRNHGFNKSDYNSWDELKEAIVKQKKPIAILPLFLYDHSGITMSTTREYPYNCRWDSMVVGFIFVDEKGCKEMGWTKKWAKDLAKCDDEAYKGKTREEILTDFLVSDVEVYDQYLTGEVYRFEVEDCDDADCGGFFGDNHEASGLLDHAKSSIDAEIKWRVGKRVEKLKEYIKAKVPVIYRTLPEIA